MPELNEFRNAVTGRKLPLLVQDAKWQQLFAKGGKTDAIISSEAELNVMLKKQQELEGEQRQLKKQKKVLMDNVVRDMEGAQLENANKKVAKRLEKDKQQLDETNSRLDLVEDRLLELPKKIARTNEELLVHTMAFCYEKLRVNNAATAEIKKWIDQVRIDLKRNLLKKQSMEQNSRQIYSYMHDIFGPQILDLFDLKYEEFAAHLPNADDTRRTGPEEAQKGDAQTGEAKDLGQEDKVTAKTDAVEEEKQLENFQTGQKEA